ncbi:MAG: DNA helicase [Muribaculum sp.]|nr:DNA helicase [Muribaculum sp.]
MGKVNCDRNMANAIPRDSRIADVQCESQVLGMIIKNTNSRNEVREIVSADCFTKPEHLIIYSAIECLDKKGESIDLVKIGRELFAQGHNEMLEAVASLVADSGYGSVYRDALYLRELASRRNLKQRLLSRLSQCEDMSEDIGEITSGVAEDANSMLKEFSDQSCMTLYDAEMSLIKQMERNMNSDGGLTGTPTGFSAFDSKGGLQAGNLIVIAAETSMGKTSFGLAIAKHAIMSGAGVAFYSMEMTKHEIAARILATQVGIPSSHLLYGRLSDDNFSKAMVNSCKDYTKRFFLDDNSTSSLDKIIASIRALKIKHGIRGAFVDYLQMLNVNMKTLNKEQLMGEAARRLKNLAKELDIWIVVISQFNRDKERQLPTLNRLRDSGQIAEAADVVMLIYRPEYYGKSYPEPFEDKETKGTAMIDVAKGRNIGMFKFIVNFHAPTTDFRELDHGCCPAKSKSGSPF